MRINRNRLDLGSVYVNRPCRIVTTRTTMTLQQDGCGAIQLDLIVSGQDPLADPSGVTQRERERGRGGFTYWVDLTRFRPDSLYVLTVTAYGHGLEPKWRLADVTPDWAPAPRRERGIMGKVFFGGRK
jgi:hypothetical protein